MKINFDSTINDLDGKPVETTAAVMKDGVQIKPAEYLTLKTVALNSLMAVLPDEQHLSGEEKAVRFALAMRVNVGGEQDLTPEEVSKLKGLIGKCYGALAVGRAYEILNG